MVAGPEKHTRLKTGLSCRNDTQASVILPGDNRQTASELSCRTTVTHYREFKAISSYKK